LTGDLATGQGIEAAVEGAGIIVFCAGSFKGDTVQIQNLIPIALRAGTRHLVYISVVGADRVPLTNSIDRAMFAYFGSKLTTERMVADSGLPWTTLRATQFYNALLLIAQQMTKLPILPVPSGFRFQPIDTGEVAARLADLALGAPAGLVAEMAGPQVYSMEELLQAYLRARRTSRPIVPIWFPGKAAGAIREGAIVAPGQGVGKLTWEDFLAHQLSS